MKGIEVAIVDPPIEPICEEYDHRPAVKDLIQEYSEKIEKIKVGIIDHPHYDSTKHDELWILRFYLSHKKSSKAIEAAKVTLDFRHEYNLDERDIRHIPPHRVTDGKVGKFMSFTHDGAILPTHPHSQRGVIMFIKPASMEMNALVENLTEDYWLPTFIYITEWSHQWLDYVTRTTGRLTKQVRFMDPEGMSLSKFNRECMKRNAHAVNHMEDYYPQLLEAAFICNPPIVVKGLFDIIRPLLPKRLKEKFHMINPTTNEKERKLLYRHISEDNLPTKYGGQNKIPIEEWEPM